MGKIRQILDIVSGKVEPAPSGRIRRGGGGGDVEQQSPARVVPEPGHGQVGENGPDTSKASVCQSCGNPDEDELNLIGFRNVFDTPMGPMMEQQLETVCDTCHDWMDLTWQFMTYKGEIVH